MPVYISLIFRKNALPEKQQNIIKNKGIVRMYDATEVSKYNAFEKLLRISDQGANPTSSWLQTKKIKRQTAKKIIQKQQCRMSSNAGCKECFFKKGILFIGTNWVLKFNYFPFFLTSSTYLPLKMSLQKVLSLRTSTAFFNSASQPNDDSMRPL